MKNQALVIGNSLEIEVRAKVMLTGGQLAALFWTLGDDEQAEFFSTLASASGGGAELYKQMHAAADKTDEDGLAVMQIIGDMAK